MIMWSIQIFLAVAFGAAGTMKLVRSKAQLAAIPHMGWVHSVPEDRIKLLGVAERRRRSDAYDAWRVRGSFNDPRRVGDRRGNVPMIVVV